MNDNAREEISVARDMLTPINKLTAISQLFDCAMDGTRLEKLDEVGFLGVSYLLETIVNEIIYISNDLDGHITELEKYAFSPQVIEHFPNVEQYVTMINRAADNENYERVVTVLKELAVNSESKKSTVAT